MQQAAMPIQPKQRGNWDGKQNLTSTKCASTVGDGSARTRKVTKRYLRGGLRSVQSEGNRTGETTMSYMSFLIHFNILSDIHQNPLKRQ
jgi:hypothetical protein